MLDIFLKFLSSIATKVFEKYSPDKDPTGKGLRKLFELYSQYCRIHDYLVVFSTTLQSWKDSNYHGGYWSECQRSIEKTAKVLNLIEDDLDDIIALEDFDLSRELKGYINLKTSLFRVWSRILDENSKDYFCGWISDYSETEWKKYVLIPNYSLVMLDVKKTSDLINISESKWYRELYGRRSVEPSVSKSYLEYLPETSTIREQPEVSNAMVKHYCKRITLPDEVEEIDKIIDMTRENVEKLRLLLEVLGDLIKKYSGGDASVFLKYLK